MYVCTTIDWVNHFARFSECIAWVDLSKPEQKQRKEKFTLGEARPVYYVRREGFLWDDE